MAKRSSMTIGKPVIQRGGAEYIKIEFVGGKFSGLVQRVRKDKAEKLIESGKAKRHDKEKGSI